MIHRLASLIQTYTSPRRWLRRSRTVRYAFPVMLLLASVVGATVVQNTASTFLSIETSQEVVQAGEQFTVSVYVTAVTPVNTVDLAIALPRQLVGINGIDTGESVITLWTVDPYIERNTVFLRGGTFRRGFVGKHLIADINVTAKANGVAAIEITEAVLYAGDGSGNEVTIQENEATSVYIGSNRLLADTTDSGDTIFSGSAVVTIETDIDGDGKVTLQDISQFLLAWRDQRTIYDFTGDGRMTFRDFGVILTESFLR